ncbi:peptidoglycan DD-metalloendopeptidase family protein [Magnetospirillum sp. XM-1]|uniref:peptidoglycan DD-metalloendopeptidase family protein n=1 Tax=Magnetospirillum sp. XM-1 TaxID=1663591 RepID=UPI000A979115|nr:peptidoglycan DD-metalloendopeptidase family protein [Magnetospirillum sp. XM-1]
MILAALLAACSPSYDSKVPVSRGPDGPLQVQRPAAVTVYAGDTVYSIARRYSLTVRDLIEANNLQPPYQLQPGTVLRLPGGGSDYVVQRGDTLSVLARRFKVDFNSLAATNGKRAPYVLHVGERLTIPGAKGSAPAAPQPPAQGGNIVVASPHAPGGGGGKPSAATATARPEDHPPAYARAPSQPAPSVASLPAAPPARAGSSFLWPVKGEVVAEFGPLPGKGQHNDGINIVAAKGTAVRAAENGVVAYVGNELKGFGNLLLIKHADNWMTAYAHNEKLLVKRGDQVKRGQTIATLGASGSVTSPQLHFEIRRGTEAVNPVDYLQDKVASAPKVYHVAMNAY